MTGILKKTKTEQKMSVRYFEGLNLWILAAVLVANIFFQLSEISSSLFVYLGTFVLIGVMFFIDKDEYIYLSVSLLSVLRFSQIFGVSAINVITFAYFFKTYIFENQYKTERKKNRLPRGVVIAGTVFILISLIYTTTYFKNVLANTKLLFFLIYLVDFFRHMENSKDADKKFMNVQVYYVAGVLIAILVALAVNPHSMSTSRMELAYRSGSNMLAISLTFCLAFVTMGMTKVRNIKEWAILAITALPLLYFCFATQSRTSIVGMIVIFASVIIFSLRQKESRLWIIMMVIASVAVLGGLILFAEGTQIHTNIMETIERFTNPKNDDISNGRFDIWKLYISKLKLDYRLFFFGGSLSDYNNRQAHNMFIETFAGYGLFGTIIFFWLYTVVFCEIRDSIKSLGKRSVRLLGFLPFFLVFFIGMASHSLQNTEPTVNFCLGVAMIYLYGERDLDETHVDNRDETGVEPFSKRKRYKNIRGMGYRYGESIRGNK